MYGLWTPSAFLPDGGCFIRYVFLVRSVHREYPVEDVVYIAVEALV